MIQVIWKYEIGIDDFPVIKMPKGAEILTIQVQNAIPCIWALIDPDAPKEIRTFQLVGTGHPIEAAIRRYVGTFQTSYLVFHLFEFNQ